MKADVATRLAFAMAQRHGLSRGPNMDDLAGACAEVMACDDAAVQLRISGRATSAIGASSQRASDAEEHQLVLDEGPSIDVRGLTDLLVARDFASEARWPNAAPALVTLGVRSAVSHPLRAGLVRLGSVTGYRVEAHECTPADRVLAADVAAGVLSVVLATPTSDDGDLVGPAVHGRAAVHQATGMVAVQLQCDVDDAVVRLRAHAFAHELNLLQVAEQVLARRLRFEP